MDSLWIWMLPGRPLRLVLGAALSAAVLMACVRVGLAQRRRWLGLHAPLASCPGYLDATVAGAQLQLSALSALGAVMGLSLHAVGLAWSGHLGSFSGAAEAALRLSWAGWILALTLPLGSELRRSRATRLRGGNRVPARLMSVGGEPLRLTLVQARLGTERQVQVLLAGPAGTWSGWVELPQVRAPVGRRHAAVWALSRLRAPGHGLGLAPLEREGLAHRGTCCVADPFWHAMTARSVPVSTVPAQIVPTPAQPASLPILPVYLCVPGGRWRDPTGASLEDLAYLLRDWRMVQ